MAEIDRSLIGVWGAEAKMPVELGKIRELARAMKDENPSYRDGAHAVAPPTFLMTIAHWIRDLGETRTAVKLDYTRLLHGEQEFEYVKPIFAGDTLTSQGKIASVEKRPGKRGGEMTFAVIETEFKNQKGEVVLYSRSTVIETAKAVEKKD
jgi:acyl dehydratase